MVMTGLVIWLAFVTLSKGQLIEVTKEFPILRGNDDASEALNGNVDINGNSLTIQYPLLSLGGGIASIGLRFDNVGIPRQTEVLSARLKLYTAQEVGSFSLSVTGCKNCDTPFSERPNEISRLVKNEPTIPWERPNTTAAANSGVESPDIRSIVQSQVNQGKWGPSSGVVIVVQSIPRLSLGAGNLNFHSFEGATLSKQILLVPKLIIKFKANVNQVPTNYPTFSPTATNQTNITFSPSPIAGGGYPSSFSGGPGAADEETSSGDSSAGTILGVTFGISLIAGVSFFAFRRWKEKQWFTSRALDVVRDGKGSPSPSVGSQSSASKSKGTGLTVVDDEARPSTKLDVRALMSPSAEGIV